MGSNTCLWRIDLYLILAGDDNRDDDNDSDSNGDSDGAVFNILDFHAFGQQNNYPDCNALIRIIWFQGQMRYARMLCVAHNLFYGRMEEATPKANGNIEIMSHRIKCCCGSYTTMIYLYYIYSLCAGVRERREYPRARN